MKTKQSLNKPEVSKDLTKSQPQYSTSKKKKKHRKTKKSITAPYGTYAIISSYF
jgi:hypothetical protein